MKKSSAWCLWVLCVFFVIFGLVRMFIGSDYWIFYALIVGIGFYLTRKIFKKYLAH